MTRLGRIVLRLSIVLLLALVLDVVLQRSAWVGGVLHRLNYSPGSSASGTGWA